MQMMGNSKARAVYEANLPNDYRRPQNDQAVEAFIRQKYEKKKYIAAEWVPSKPPDFPVGWDEAGNGNQLDKKPEFKKLNVPAASKPAPSPEPVKTSQPAPVKPSTQVQQVKSSVPRSASSSLASDLLGLEISSSTPATVPAPAVSNVPTSSSAQDLLGLNSEFSDFVSATPASVVSSASSTTTSLPSEVSDSKPVSSRF